MGDVIDYKILGGDLQLVDIQLDPGEGVMAEAGSMVYMTDGVVMQTDTGGGVIKGLRRMITGESFFITSFINEGQGVAHAGFAAPFPGRIVPIQLEEYGGRIVCQKDAFLCAAKGIDINVALTKRLGAGFFGGEGFILQRLEGTGLAFIHAGGTIIKRQLAAGESLRVDTGCLVAMSESVDYDIQMVRGFKNALFGGEGLFLAHLRGPGTVYLQSLPLARLADRLTAATMRRDSSNIGGVGAAIGLGAIGTMLSRD